MTTVFLIRHTQAEGNLYRAMQGHWDGGITAIGKLQIGNLRERMQAEHVDAVYSSDLYRAWITAKEGVADPRGLRVITDKRLRELDMGSWERCFFGNLQRDWPEESRLFMFDSEHWNWPGAETFDDVRQRVYECVEEIARENDGKSVAVISHGVALRCFLSKVFSVDLSDVETVPICKNTAITRLKYENGRFTAVFKNDYSHLGAYDPPKWNSTADLSDRPLNPAEERDYYIECYREGWSFAHDGSLEDFQPTLCLAKAEEHFAAGPLAVRKLLIHGEEAGLVELDLERGAAQKIGWISLIYLKPEYRGKGYGIQALGRGILAYEGLGRECVRLFVNRKNTAALAFYRKYGFTPAEETDTGFIMERMLSRGRTRELQNRI